MTVAVLLIVDQEFRGQIVQFANADIAAVSDGYKNEGLDEAREVIGQRMSAPGGSDYLLLQRNRQRLAGNLATMRERTGILTLPNPAAGPGHQILGVATYIAPGLYVFSGSDTFNAAQARRHILAMLIWVFAGAVLLAILAGILVSRSFLSRADAITRACGAIMQGNLSARVPVRGTQYELDRLSQAINAMLDRIAGLMENVRQVTNDIAHDLRTPVTHLRHRLEHARLTAAAPEQYDKALEAAIATSDAILALFAALLRIAQIEGGARRAAFARVDLAEMLHNLREMFGPVADDAGHTLTLSIEGTAFIRGDRELLVQLFSNLIENAIVHTPQGTSITLSLRGEHYAVLVSVSDNGPGVPPEEHVRLFQPLYRREASRSRPGYGLGLALVSAIAELHDAKMTTAPVENSGFSITIRFAPETG